MSNKFIDKDMVRKIDENAESLIGVLANALEKSAEKISSDLGIGINDVLRCADWYSYNPEFNYEQLMNSMRKAA